METSYLTPNKTQPGNVMLALLVSGIICGTLDALYATLINYKIPPANIWIFVASGVYGKAAAAAPNMVTMGLIFHYLIAFSFSSVLILCYPTIKIIFRNRFLIGILYGLTVWCIMNLLVVPLSNTPKLHFHIGAALLNMLALVLAIGIPASLIAHRLYFYVKK